MELGIGISQCHWDIPMAVFLAPPPCLTLRMESTSCGPRSPEVSARPLRDSGEMAQGLRRDITGLWLGRSLGVASCFQRAGRSAWARAVLGRAFLGTPCHL